MLGRVYRCHTRGIFCGRTILTEMSGTGIDVVLNVPKCRVPVLKSIRTYRGVGYRYRVRNELHRIVREGIEAVPIYFGGVNTPGIRYHTLPKCRVPVLRSHRIYVSDTGIDFVPKLTGVFGRVLRPHRTLR